MAPLILCDRAGRLKFLLGVGVIIATVVGTTCSTNARLDDLRDEIADWRDEIADWRDEIRGMRAEAGPRIRDVRRAPR